MKEEQKSILVQKNTTQSFTKELLMHVTPRMHLNCANERNQMQKATYYMISCQWISGNGTTVGTEMYPWLPGYRSGGRSLNANSPREHFQTNGTFSAFLLW